MLPIVALAETLRRRGVDGQAGEGILGIMYFSSQDVNRICLSSFEHIPKEGLSCFGYFPIAFSMGSSSEPTGPKWGQKGPGSVPGCEAPCGIR